jgi:signal transduction histidine kinase
LDREGVITLAEGRGLVSGALGIKPDEVVGRSAFDVLRGMPKISDTLRRALAGEAFISIIEVGSMAFETQFSPVRSEDGEVVGVIGVATDVTQQKRAAEESRRLAQRLLGVHEEERRAIARELHDEIGQLLTGLSLTLETCVRSPQQATTDRLRETQGSVDELISRVSDLSLDLRPAMLDDLGLLPALLWHLERYASRTGVRVDFKHNGLEGRFAPEVETAAYRIIQEALTNVARHAGVSETTVRLWADQDTLLVRIEDQGTGFDPAAVLAAGHASGLAGMQERAALCGGQLTVDSESGAGTRLTLEMPAGGATEQGKR